MQKILAIFFAVSTCLSVIPCYGSDSQSTFTLKSGPATVCFTPEGDCTGVIVAALGKARESVLIQAYSFTSGAVADALADLFSRGVKVEAILDKSQRNETRSMADFLFHTGIPTYIDRRHGIAHNKVMIIDGRTVITGSFNFTKAAQKRNAENLLVLHDPILAGLYTRNWQLHCAHSEEY